MLNKLFVRDRAFYRAVLVLALPVVMQNMITIGVNMLDRNAALRRVAGQ